MSKRSDQELAGILLHHLEERPGAPVRIPQLVRMLGLSNDSRRRVRRLLQGLVRDGRVVASGRGRYELAGHLPTERGRLLFLHSLSASFSEQVQSEARTVTDCNASRRQDLRSVVHVTIDPKDAKDFDDAVALERRPDGFRLLVSIADVASFVKDGGAIDREALRRGTSVYLPGTCFPMLPAKLSEDVCSLSPGKEKATLTVELLLDRTGHVRGGSIFRSLIRSAMRLTYEQVQELLDGAGGPVVPREIHELVRGLADCASGLLALLADRGSLDLDLPESEIVLDNDGRPIQVAPTIRLFSHRLIEASMIAANEAVGRMLWRAGAPTLFRVHPPPDPERMQAFASIAAVLGAPVSFGESPSASQLAAYLESLSGKPARGVLQQLLLRSLMQARYSTVREDHFGLGATCYVHFTSPIRRYPDLMIHRQIGALIDSRYPEGLLLDEEPPRVDSFPVNVERASAMAESCSNAERRAMEAERQATALYQADYLEQHLGEEFAGTIVYVTEFGFFVRIEPSGIEGLVHVARLSNDYYRFAEERLTLYGSHTGKEFRVGMPVTVRVETVDLRLRRIDFQLMEVST